MTSRWTKVAALVLAGAVIGGCAEEREPINRVQANALKKNFFVGDDLKSAEDDPEFYTAVTVTDVPFGADQLGVFPGYTGELRRVKWEITEDVLNARMTYEEIDGVDGHGSTTTNSGRVVAAFRIESHFDIKRSYNPQTGEDLNIIDENTSDRPWYERAYMRVDWSKNLITTSTMWDPLALQKALGDTIDAEPLAYYIDDPNHPDAPVFDTQEGYFDISNRLYLSPRKVTVFGQTVTACLYRGSIVIGASAPWGNCDNSEITVRYSFRKVGRPGDANFTDYEPIHWDGSRMNSFGVFTTDRLGWSNRYGIIDNEWRRFAQRYNLWQRSHSDVECNTKADQIAKLDPHADGDGNGTHDQCETAGAGSRCDDLTGLCTIPYAKRDLRPVAWHYSAGPEGDDTILEWTKKATREWDVAIRVAVQAARLVECRRTNANSLVGTKWEGIIGGVPKETPALACDVAFPVLQGDDVEKKHVDKVFACYDEKGYPWATGKGAAVNDPSCPDTYDSQLPLAENGVANMRPMVVFCHNPVRASDDVACGKEGLVTRPGDIRYHNVNVWPTRQSSSPWGYGPTRADPLTGEAISASINVYNAVTDAAAQGFVDQLRWMAGELSSQDISSGSYIRDWVDADTPAAAKAAGQLGGGFRLPQEEIAKRIGGINGLNPEDVAKAQLSKFKLNMREFRDSIKTDLYWNQLPPELGHRPAEYDARINAAKGTKIEAALTGAMWGHLAGPDSHKHGGDAMEQISPLRGMRSHIVREASQQLELALAKRGQCILGAPEPTGLPALAKIMKEKFPISDTASPAEVKARVDKMFDYLRGRMHYSVILHEMGHTVGYRHNFTSSYDKFNFRPQYWQLRTDNDTVNEPCVAATDDGSSCVGPRYVDPLTQDEVDNSIWTWQHTTVMDYPGDLTQDMVGLGVYDYAAARMFYGDVVDVANDPNLIATVRDQDGNPIITGSDEGNEVAELVDFSGGLVGQVVARPGTNQNEFMHYSEWNKWFRFIRNCRPADTSPPAGWDEAKDGVYSPLFDGHIVKGTVCDRIPVDYVAYTDLLPDQLADQQGTNPRFFTSRRARDKNGRPRMPYAFESDEYADGWSPSTYRHDNGADLYEELTFHSNLYENRHIFDNFRNGRVNFTVYGAYQRAMSRYHYKISNLTQGVSYLVGFYLREWAKNRNLPFSLVLSANVGPSSPFYDSAIGAAIGFDHFVRVMTRPHVGPHFKTGDGFLMPEEDIIGGTGSVNGVDPTQVDVFNGTAVTASGDVSFGGRPLNNDFQFGHGYWGIDYLNQAGAYYEKTYAIEAMLEASYRSFNFWRFDGLDARFHHINYTDLYREGMRRLIGVMLTGDRELIAPRVATDTNNLPLVVTKEPGKPKYPTQPFGWVSYINSAGPEVCWPINGVLTCQDAIGGKITNPVVPNSVPLDPQLGFEVQKFVGFWSYVYLPGAQDNDWVDMMRIYVVGPDKDPDYLPKQRVEWRDPETGLRYIAKRYGDETLLGKTYDKGIGAKMIQWANALTAQAYELDPTQPNDPVTGAANVVVDANGLPKLIKVTSCEDSARCIDLRAYRGLMDFMRDTAAQLGFPEPALQVYGGD